MAADVEADETVFTEFGILGPLQVCRSGCEVPLSGPRLRAVLALLLEVNRAVSMDRRAEDVWGGHHPMGGSRFCRHTYSTRAGRWSRTGPAAPAGVERRSCRRAGMNPTGNWHTMPTASSWVMMPQAAVRASRPPPVQAADGSQSNLMSTRLDVASAD
jgi:hypothetical protein